MKIPSSVRGLYDDLVAPAELLAEEVTRVVGIFRERRWHYEGRIKELESFAQKLETGRVHDLQAIDDLFACTIVVENNVAIKRAVQSVETNFEVIRRRPDDPKVTSKSSECFPFDDLRMYVKLRKQPSLPDSPLSEIVFEIQVRTFLQHAWSIATHDLVYKGGKVSWSNERIAFQIKAMLEHAELSIEQAETFAKAPELAKSDDRKRTLQNICDFCTERWKNEDLPTDLKRLAENINTLLRSAELSLESFTTIFDGQTSQGKGAQMLSLSPYGAIVQALLDQKSDGLKKRFRNKKFKVFIPAEVEIPEQFEGLVMDNFVRIVAPVESVDVVDEEIEEGTTDGHSAV
jgi:ppGpp synthetase/RelA/SpoT-type nucleotidyltranferase